MSLTKEQAIAEAKKRLNNRFSDIVKEYENSIKLMTPDHPTIGLRGGDYTPEVRKEAIKYFSNLGWSVSYNGYWLNLT